MLRSDRKRPVVGRAVALLLSLVALLGLAPPATSAPGATVWTPEQVQIALRLHADTRTSQMFRDRSRDDVLSQLAELSPGERRELMVAASSLECGTDFWGQLCETFVTVVDVVTSPCPDIDRLTGGASGGCEDMRLFANGVIRGGTSYVRQIYDLLEILSDECTYNPSQYPCYCIVPNTPCPPPYNPNE